MPSCGEGTPSPWRCTQPPPGATTPLRPGAREGESVLVPRDPPALRRPRDRPRPGLRRPGFDDGLWPEGPAPLGYEFSEGRGGPGSSCEAAKMAGEIAALEGKATDRRSWRFQGAELQWQHDLLSDLAGGPSDRFADPDPRVGALASMRERDRARAKIPADQHRRASRSWDRAAASSRAAGVPPYGGPHRPAAWPGPRGPGSAFGAVGVRPPRDGRASCADPEGKLVLSDDMGSSSCSFRSAFRMGAERPAPEAIGAPNVDPHAARGRVSREPRCPEPFSSRSSR